MNPSDQTATNRRRFLRYLACSPLLLSPGALGALLREVAANGGSATAGPAYQELGARLQDLIASPDDAINVFDFEPVAQARLPPAHYGYLATGVEDDATLRENREAFARIYLRPRRLMDVSAVDMSTDLFGTSWPSPIVLAPAGSQKAFHPDGEIAAAKAAKNQEHLQILSTVSTTSVEAVAAARGGPIWYQLYPTSQWEITRSMIRRAEDAGCPVLVLTVDLPTSSNRETERRYKQRDRRDCTACHVPGIQGLLERKPMFDGTDTSALTGFLAPGMTWEFVEQLKATTSMKIVLKGIVTREDAAQCLRHGVDGIIVSNHGGRAEESRRATIDSLPEVVEAVGGKIPILMDSGIRRGSDAFKALALGAKAVCIGRPYLWGLAAFGQAGVEAVLSILRRELMGVMMFAGTRSVQRIDGSFIARN